MVASDWWAWLQSCALGWRAVFDLFVKSERGKVGALTEVSGRGFVRLGARLFLGYLKRLECKHGDLFFRCGLLLGHWSDYLLRVRRKTC